MDYCTNELTVKGAGSKEFYNAFKGHKIDWNNKRIDETEVVCLNALWPVPEDIIKRVFENGIYEEAYDWSCKNWGVKDDVYGKIHQHPEPIASIISDDEVFYSLETPWSGIDEWLVNVSKKYPELEFHLRAIGSGFNYISLYKNGVEVGFTDCYQ